MPVHRRLRAHKRDVIFFHGSPEDVECFIVRGGPSVLFEGVFASSTPDVARSHGDHIYYAIIDDARVLTDYALNYEIPYEDTARALESVSTVSRSSELWDDLWRIVIEEDLDFEAVVILFGGGTDEALWEAQAVRGRVATRLGYLAVEMHDEHGTSWLLSPGVKMFRFRGHESDIARA